jgi:hypothetical protein
MKILFRGLTAAACATALLAAPAFAAPTTVDLRIEGPTRTLFEGQVTTDVRTFRFSNESTQHRCDGVADDTAPPTPSPQPTRGGAIATASEQFGFSMTGSWFDGLGPSFSEINGESVAFDPATNRFLAEYENWQFASSGSCQDSIVNGDTVLFAYGDGSEPLLRLSGPATVRPGQPFGVRVVNGSTGAAIDGASVGGSTTNGSGDATLTLDDRGAQSLKASKPNTIRSNALQVCVSDGADGFCGSRTPSGEVRESAPAGAGARDRTAPHSLFSGIRDGQVFRRGAGPRVVRGRSGEPVAFGSRSLRADSSGLLMVKLRLTRTSGRRCSAWNRTRERFLRRRCGVANGWWFRISDRERWEYQLAQRLPRGRYVLDVKAIDRAYNRDEERRRGANRVIFRVR